MGRLTLLLALLAARPAAAIVGTVLSSLGPNTLVDFVSARPVVV